MLLILLAGLIIRLISLNQSLWLDEATSALVARMPLTDIFTKFLPGDFHPPLYYLILKYWVSIFGSSEISLRIPSIIFGMATVYIVYLIGKKVAGPTVGLMSAALLATSGLAVYYSQEARMYSLAMFLVALAFYLFQKEKWVLFSITLAAVGMTDYVSLLIIPVFWILSFKKWKKLALAHLPLLMVFLLWLPIFIRQVSAGVAQAGTAWWNILGPTTVKNIALIPVKFMIGRISFENDYIYGAIVVFLGLVFAYLLYLARRSPKLIWGWLVIPAAFGVLIGLKVPTLSFFRFLFALPALYLLAAVGIEKAGKFKYLFLGFLVAINLITTGYYLFNPGFQREDWRRAAQAIGADKVVFPAGSQREALIYYGKGSQIIRVSDIEPSDSTIWLSRYVWEIVDPTDATRIKVEKLGYNKAGESNFNGVVLWKYVKNQYASRN